VSGRFASGAIWPQVCAKSTPLSPAIYAAAWRDAGTATSAAASGSSALVRRITALKGRVLARLDPMVAQLAVIYFYGADHGVVQLGFISFCLASDHMSVSS
jgi:hypothetical protein